MKTIAILGGSFDPIHLGHIAAAEAAARELGFDLIKIIPTGDPPHKRCYAAAADRFRMAELAANAAGKGVGASDIETARVGTTYTVDTLRALKALEPDAALYYIIGGDTLLQLETWRAFDEVAGLLHGFVVAIRPGTDESDTRAEMHRLSKEYALSFELLRLHGPDISSTAIREAIQRGRPFASLVAPDVKAYIGKKGLYLNQVREALGRELNPDRYRHVLGVETAAAELAMRHGADICVARLTALLHDCAKNLTIEEMRSLVSRASIPVDDDELISRQLLHAPAGAVLAKEKYGVDNPEILSAIRWHTVGKRGMTALEKLLYVADAIEPYREDLEGLEEIRALSKTNLDETVYRVAERKGHYVSSRGFVPNRHTIELINTKNVEGKK